MQRKPQIMSHIPHTHPNRMFLIPHCIFSSKQIPIPDKKYIPDPERWWGVVRPYPQCEGTGQSECYSELSFPIKSHISIHYKALNLEVYMYLSTNKVPGGQNSRQCSPFEEVPSKVWERERILQEFQKPILWKAHIMVKCFKSFLNVRLWHISRPNPKTKITKSDSFIT